MDESNGGGEMPPKDIIARTRFYQPSSPGPWVVYFRRKNKPLNVLSISRDLTRKYPGTVIHQVKQTKLRVTAPSYKAANEIAQHEAFSCEYTIYVPAREVEVEGKILDEMLTCEDIKSGFGRFKNRSIPDVAILDCKRLSKASIEGSKKVYSPSAFFRVTFPGSVLPEFVVIDGAFYPVRLFRPKVFNCTKCKQFGHSDSFCDNKPRCGKCNQAHLEDSCTQEAEKCSYCGGDPHDLQDCPAYKRRIKNESRSIIRRSKQTYAEMVKSFKTPDSVSESAVPVENPFHELSSDDQDDDETDEGGSSSEVHAPGKRKSSSSPGLRRKVFLKSSLKSLPNTKGSGVNLKTPNKQAPDYSVPCCSKDPVNPPPTVKYTSKKSIRQSSKKKATKAPRTSTKPPKPKRGLLTFRVLVDRLYDAIGLPDTLRGIIDIFIPTVEEYLRNLTQSWPLLASLISFDG
uniref:Putative loner ele1 n=1 Tax=Aedes albopictus TaxID=7160 RepID=A0A1W7R6G6_AEDAL